MNATPASTRSPVRAFLATLSGTILGLSATVSQAADETPGYVPRPIVVQYADLNLESQQGIQRLYQRIVGAANTVCETGDNRSLRAVVHDKHCKERAIARAVATVDRAQLTALYAATTGRPAAASNRVANR